MTKPLDSKTNGNCRAEVYGDYQTLESYQLIILEGTHESSWKDVFSRRKRKKIPLEGKLTGIPKGIIIQPSNEDFYLEIQYETGHNDRKGPFSLDE